MGDAGDYLAAAPIGHAVDPDDQAARRQAAQMVIALHQHDLGAQAPGRDGRRRARWPAADHQHVGLGKDRRLARRLPNGQGRPRTPWRPFPAAKYLGAPLATDRIGEIFATHIILAPFVPVPVYDHGNTRVSPNPDLQYAKLF